MRSGVRMERRSCRRTETARDVLGNRSDAIRD